MQSVFQILSLIFLGNTKKDVEIGVIGLVFNTLKNESAPKMTKPKKWRINDNGNIEL